MASQVNHFKEFATVADYEAYIQPDDYAKPLVALVDETDTVMFPQGGGGGDCGNPILKSVDVEDFTGTTFQDSRRYITEAVIPDGVTKINDSAFQYCYSLTSVAIPSSVTSIGNYVFQNCEALTSIDIPAGVISIGASAFYNCSSLTSIDIPAGVTTISENAFRSCTSLASIDIPAGVISIGGSAFQSCSALTSVNFLGEPNLKSITQNAFRDCSSLTSVNIPSSVTSIGDRAFYFCQALASVTVRATTPPTLGNNAFQGTPANMVIYVPAESVQAYKTASGWSTYASQIQAIP